MNTIQTGALIAQTRKEKGLTQSDLSHALHVSVQAVSKWERGLNFPDVTLLEPLGDLLGLTVSELMAGARHTPAHDELVRDSLRLGSAQLGSRVKKWRRLFSLTAALLLLLALFVGYPWVRDNTDWLPQHETILTPVEIGEMDALIARLSGQTCFSAFDLTLADGLEKYVFQIERWDSTGLVESDAIMSCPLVSPDGNDRHRQIAFSLQAEDGNLTLNLLSGGLMATPHLAVAGDAGWGAAVSRIPTAIPPEKGAILLYVGIDTDGDGVPIPMLHPNTDPEIPAGQSVILLRLMCR